MHCSNGQQEYLMMTFLHVNKNWDIVLSPSDTKLIPLTPTSAQSSKNYISRL